MTEQQKTPYAVICPDHGRQYLSEVAYDIQLADQQQFGWRCPIENCQKKSEWDDDNYEKTVT